MAVCPSARSATTRRVTVWRSQPGGPCSPPQDGPVKTDWTQAPFVANCHDITSATATAMVAAQPGGGRAGARHLQDLRLFYCTHPKQRDNGQICLWSATCHSTERHTVFVRYYIQGIMLKYMPGWAHIVLATTTHFPSLHILFLFTYILFWTLTCIILYIVHYYYYMMNDLLIPEGFE
jgi:hypothetical protein